MIAFRIRTKPFLQTKNVILMHFAQEQVKKTEKVEDKLRKKSLKPLATLPVFFLKANPRIQIFLSVIVLNKHSTIRCANLSLKKNQSENLI